MLEHVQSGQPVSKARYKTCVPPLRLALLRAQRRLLQADFPVLILVSGADGAGKGETINLLNEWMDPRHIMAHAFAEPTDEERLRPPYWRFWRALPPRGRIGLYVGSWYSEPISQRMDNLIGESELEQRLARITVFEQTLTDDGALVVKLWLHLSPEGQRERLEALAREPKTAWRVTERDWQHLSRYETFLKVADQILRRTNTIGSPWTVVEASEVRQRNLTVGRHLLRRIEAALGSRPTRAPTLPAASPAAAAREDGRHARPLAIDTSAFLDTGRPIFDPLDLSEALGKTEYKRRRVKFQEKLGCLARAAYEKEISSIALFEGPDAAGKGGIIRRIVPALDARHCQVIPTAAPSEEERAHHYLWRFWRNVPRAGDIRLYDRSWYGRVLVERVEGFARRNEWIRAYSEINDFEKQLTDFGIVLLKFWVHIDPEEQLRRFQERERIPWKRHKITAEDYRNREKWAAYVQAASEMVERTTTDHAPWSLIEGNDKRYARLKALRLYCLRLEQALDS